MRIGNKIGIVTIEMITACNTGAVRAVPVISTTNRRRVRECEVGKPRKNTSKTGVEPMPERNADRQVSVYNTEQLCDPKMVVPIQEE